MEKKRSVGVTLFGVLYLCVGLVSLANLTVFTFLYLFCGVGLLLRRSSARYAAILTSLLAIGISAVALPRNLQALSQQGKSSLEMGVSLGLYFLLHLGAIAFFARPKVRAYFR